MGHSKKQSETLATTTLHLPDEIWENIVKFVNYQPSLESLSLVSKQLLSVTNRFKSSLTIFITDDDDQTLNLNLSSLFHRFPNITSLNVTPFLRFNLPHRCDLDAILCQISNYPNLQLKSLNLSNHYKIPSEGFKALAEKLKTSLKSLICSNIVCLHHTDLEHITNCFPLLEELDLSLCRHNPNYIINGEYPDISKFNLVIEAMSLALPNLRKFNLSRNYYIMDSSLLQLFKNCVFLEEVVMFGCKSLTVDGIASAIRERPNLKSFFIDNSCYLGNMHIDNSQLIHSLASLEGLNCVDLTLSRISNDLLSSITREALPWKKLVLNGWCDLTYDGIFSLLCKCQFLQHLDLQKVSFLNDQHVADLSLILGKLVYIDVSFCCQLTDSAMFALLRNCPLLGEIRMKSTCIGKCNVVKDFDYVNPYPRLKSLHLGSNSRLNDESIKFYASIFPNLELLDLSLCSRISGQGVFEVLRRCLKIRHLTVKFSPDLRLPWMNFQVPKLEVLSFSYSGIDDETLYVISKSCSGLLEIKLDDCDVTEIGVRLVVENCTKLRKISLLSCHEVAADVFVWMINSRPSLRKIVVPHRFHLSDSEEKLFSDRGCLIGYD